MHATLPVSPASTSLGQAVNGFSKTVPGKIVLAVSASALVALCAHISLPLPFTPVPLTLGNFAVLLVGMMLGPVVGFSALVLYLAEGAAGLPVFTPQGPGGIAQLLGPSAGYLLSYPLAAAAAGMTGRFAGRNLTRFSAALATGIAATAFILISGATWLGHLLHLSAPATWHLAVEPFVFGEMAKISAAAGIFSSTRRWLRS
ncbi:MAG TPA: biotin transporter BioY [Granulicella sp.]|jgi:biotin transport system substrate-specific component|nr:biotin transporter BioY [Granulicella sp.]